MKKRPTICVDLDGVLSDYSGWKGPKVIDPPIAGAAAFTHTLGKLGRVMIHTTRCKLEAGDRTGIESTKQLEDIVRFWLNVHTFHYDEIYIGQGKPFASVYIDDRAIVCTPQRPRHSQYPMGEYHQAIVDTKELLERKALKRNEEIDELKDSLRFLRDALRDISKGGEYSPQFYSRHITKATELLNLEVEVGGE